MSRQLVYRLRMTPANIDQLRRTLSRPQKSDWPNPPIVVGNWRDLSGDLALDTLVSINDWLEDEGGLEDFVEKWAIDRVRLRPLSCYEDSVLIELGGYSELGLPGLINIISHDDGLVLMDGSSAHIHELNLSLPPRLETLHQQTEYLSLFMNWVHGEEGRFQPVGNETDLSSRMLSGAMLDLANHELAPLAPTEAENADNGLSYFSGTVLYGSSLFRAVMALSRHGMVEMVDDEEMVGGLPVRQEFLDGPLLYCRI